MSKKVWNDFWDSFRWKNVKMIYKNFGSVWMMIYLGIMPLWTGATKSVDFGGYYIWLIAFEFAVLTASVVRIKLPKQMFLAPMNQSERASYLKSVLGLKLLIPSVLSLGLSVILFARGKYPTGYVIALVIANIALTFCTSVTTWPGSIWYNGNITAATEQEYDVYGNTVMKRLSDKRLKGLTGWSITGFCISLMTQMMVGILMEPQDVEAEWLQVITAIECICLVLISIKVVRYVPVLIELSADYEKSNGMNEMESK